MNDPQLIHPVAHKKKKSFNSFHSFIGRDLEHSHPKLHLASKKPACVTQAVIPRYKEHFGKSGLQIPKKGYQTSSLSSGYPFSSVSVSVSPSLSWYDSNH